MARERVVIFGGTGFIGNYVVRRCVQAGYEVTVMVRPGGHREYLAPLHDAITVLTGDFMVKTDVHRALTGAAVAIALVGTTIPATAIHDPTHELFATILPYVNFLDAAVSCEVSRVIVASSGGTVYGEAAILPTPEDSPLSPLSPYGIAKATVERYCAFYTRQFGLDTRVLRVANPYGWGQRVQSGQGIVGAALGCILEKKPFTMYGDGGAVRDFVYVDDVAEAFLRAVTYTGEERVFNIGSGEGMDLNSVLSLIQQVTGHDLVQISLPARPFDVHANVLDVSRARDHLGWEPTTSLSAGLRMTWKALLGSRGPE